MKDILATVELDPVTLIDGVIPPIGGVADVELKQKTSVCVCVCVSSPPVFKLGAVRLEIPISSAQLMTSPPYPRTQ